MAYCCFLRSILFLFLTLGFVPLVSAQCGPNQSEVIVVIVPDGYPDETSWSLTVGGTQMGSGFSVGDTLCAPQGECLHFTINDSYGDGICCAYGNGAYYLVVDGDTVGTGGNFTYSDELISGCPQGSYCQNPLPVAEGSYTAQYQNTYYEFNCTLTGTYEITTCGLSSCDTKIWVYGECNGQVTSPDNEGTLFYDDDNGGCGQQAVVQGIFEAGNTYLIRLGYDLTNPCSADTVNFSLTYEGPVAGCMDPAACNYNSLATVAGTCYYSPDPNCQQPDLAVMEQAIANSLNLRDQLSMDCMAQEGCMTGYGVRKVLAFDTHIKNIGQADYFIGDPTNNPGQFAYSACHQHYHYEGYAEYRLYKPDGTLLPIGQKNGFCVLDLECNDGGTFQYSCGLMGISHGCGDIYDNALDCQWIDITDIDTGYYTLAVVVNWDHSPDAYGNYESSYENNMGQVCIHLTRDAGGNWGFEVLDDCPQLVDCMGIPHGNAQVDCNGDCDGTAVRGDLNADLDITAGDATLYVDRILNNTITPSECRDLSADNLITVWDAGLASSCDLYGPNDNKCAFPRTITRYEQQAAIGYTVINTTEQYIDLFITNPDNELVGYELNVSGITIADAENRISSINYPMTPRFTIGGTKVIGLPLATGSLIPKYTVPTNFLRVYYSEITDASAICVSGIVHVLNKAYEPIDVALVDACVSVLGVEATVTDLFSVFPNPAATELTIRLVQAAKAKTEVKVVDQAGRVVMTAVLPSGSDQLQLPVDQLARGWYMVRLGTASRAFIRQ